MVEDAVVGVEAGRRGGFGLVVGIDRAGGRAAALGAWADVVVADLDDLDLEGVAGSWPAAPGRDGGP
jgi:beta-phosphoglucomutase-like phosphatase (HAD superfamily)